jgi:hypothetical protein
MIRWTGRDNRERASKHWQVNRVITDNGSMDASVEPGDRDKKHTREGEMEGHT